MKTQRQVVDFGNKVIADNSARDVIVGTNNVDGSTRFYFAWTKPTAETVQMLSDYFAHGYYNKFRVYFDTGRNLFS